MKINKILFVIILGCIGCSPFFPKQEDKAIQLHAGDKIIRFYTTEKNYSTEPDLSYTYFFNQSVLTTEGTYNGQLLDGDYAVYSYHTNQPIIKGSFKKGLKDDAWYYFTDDGSLLKVEEWKNGMLEEQIDQSESENVSSNQEDSSSFSLKSFFNNMFKKDSVKQ